MTRISFYGPLADAIASDLELEMPADIHKLGDLRGLLAERYPEHAGTLLGPRTKWVLDEHFAKDDASLDGVKLVECLPPVSGG